MTLQDLIDKAQENGHNPRNIELHIHEYGICWSVFMGTFEPLGFGSKILLDLEKLEKVAMDV